MKYLAVVFVFAFVAVQFSCSAPTPDEDKKEEAGGSPAKVTDPSLPTSEVKSPVREQGVAVSDPAPPAEEKKA